MNNPKIIVLTGCSRGLGCALLDEFCAAGHRVHGIARSEAAINELNERHAIQGSFSVVDVCDEAAVGRWSKDVLEQDGPPDIVVNNAAMINKPANLWEVPEAEFAQLFDANVSGVHRVIRHFLPSMVKRQSGVIVNLSSGWGRSVSAEMAPYCASKWAIEGLTKALAEELPSSMAAIPLSPGVIDTDMLRQTWGEGAGGFRKADVWAKKAAPFILGLGPRHNGQSLTTPE